MLWVGVCVLGGLTRLPLCLWQAHSSRVGARALVLSPTRELAMQTVKFAKGLSKFTDLRVGLAVKGSTCRPSGLDVDTQPHDCLLRCCCR